MNDQRPCTTDGECEPFSHPVGCLDDVEIRLEAASREGPRKRTFDAHCSSRQAPPDLAHKAGNAATVKMNTGAHPILVGLSLDAREDVHLMPSRDESASHDLGVRPDPTATCLGWIFPRNEKDAKRSPTFYLAIPQRSGFHGAPTIAKGAPPPGARSVK